jgi:hypothetical protein
VVNGQTVPAGGIFTLADGTPVSVGPNGSIVVVGGSTITLPSAGAGMTTGTGTATSHNSTPTSHSTSTASSRGVGGAIASGIGIAPPAKGDAQQHLVSWEAGAILGLLCVLGVL